MSKIRRLIIPLSAGIGSWVLISFTGTMLGAPGAEAWTSSLMWALLAALLVFPMLLMANHHASKATETDRTVAPSNAQKGDKKAFVEGATTLWPEPQGQPRSAGEKERSQDGWPWSREDVDPTVAA